MRLLIGIIIFAVLSVLLVDVIIFDSTMFVSRIYGSNEINSITGFDNSDKKYVWKSDNLKYYIDSNGLSESKSDVVENVISGTGSITNSESISWQEALSKINTKYVENNVPNRLERTEIYSIADIIITLSEDKKETEDGMIVAGFTTVSFHPLFGLKKSFVTLYDVDEMTDKVLQSVTRHEFGHAIGLPHSQRSYDVMKESLQIENVEITVHTMDDLYRLYN